MLVTVILVKRAPASLTYWANIIKWPYISLPPSFLSLSLIIPIPIPTPILIPISIPIYADAGHTKPGQASYINYKIIICHSLYVNVFGRMVSGWSGLQWQRQWQWHKDAAPATIGPNRPILRELMRMICSPYTHTRTTKLPMTNS